MRPPGLVAQVFGVVAKEFLVEWRDRSRVSGVFFFAFAMVLMIGFASPSESVLSQMAGGALWVGLLLASTRALDQSYAVELEHGALEGMVLWPVRPTAIFYGKALANTVILVCVAFGLLPLIIGMYDAPVRGRPELLVATIAAGCAAIGAPGTLYAAITAQARGSSVLLPLLLFPLVVPALLAAARATTVIIDGDPMGQAPDWLGLLLAFNALHWILTGLFYTFVVEDA